MQAQLFQLATFISSEIIEWPRDTQILASGCAQCQEKWKKGRNKCQGENEIQDPSESLENVPGALCASIAFLHSLQ